MSTPRKPTPAMYPDYDSYKDALSDYRVCAPPWDDDPEPDDPMRRDDEGWAERPEWR